MNIVLVIDQFDNGNNGTTITARRFAEELRYRGHTVKILAAGEPEPDKICVPTHSIPVFQSLVESQGMCFAKPVEEAYYQAFKNADIIHFYMPFRFCRKGEFIARQMGIPTIAAFHVQSESITSSVFLGKCEIVNDFLYNWFRKVFYNRFHSIHCPSQFVADQLKKHNYDSKLYIISNGVDKAFCPPENPVLRTDNTFRILMVGRLSREKRQDLIIEAAKISRHKENIQLIFAGKGPLLKKYRKMGESLPRKPIFDFYSKDNLVKLIQSCDLYVHASDAETEGISCMEAFSCGLVPIISDSKKSATNQFALDSKCTFKAGNVLSLAEKIDYWLDHPVEKEKMSQRYIRYGNTMRVDSCVEKAEKMYQETINEWKILGPRKPKESALNHTMHPDTDKIIQKYGNKGRSWLVSAFTNLLSPLLYLLDTVVWGFSVEGRENLADVNGGAVTVMNHVHPMDCTMVKLATFPHRLHFISMKMNLEKPILGWFLKICGAIPLPEKPMLLAKLEKKMEKEIKRGEWIHYFAEGVMIRYHKGLRPFRRGAFLTAVRAECPVVPMRLVYRKPQGIRKLWRKKPFLHLIIGEPIYPDESLSRKDAVLDLMERTYKTIENMGLESESI